MRGTSSFFPNFWVAISSVLCTCCVTKYSIFAPNRKTLQQSDIESPVLPETLTFSSTIKLFLGGPLVPAVSVHCFVNLTVRTVLLGL